MASTGMLAGQVAVITGAARGIGLSVARRYAAEGAAVVLADIEVDRATAAASEISAYGYGPARALHLDVTSPESVAGVVATVRRELGGADCVVANAGILHLRHVVDTEVEDWRRMLDVNLTGVFLTCRDFARDMLSRDTDGRIIITSSLFGRRGGIENAAYSATKFGVLGLMQSLAAELAPRNILVNAVCPGQIDTEMNTQLLNDRATLTGVTPDDIRARLLGKIPMGRLGNVDEVADAFVYFASPLSRYVTGQHLVVDGGWEVG